MTPGERDAWLDEELDPNKPGEVLYYHRDGTLCKTRREGLAVLENRSEEGPDSHWVAYTQGSRKVVSTVFLGLDHSFALFAPRAPLIFESMVFPADRETGITDYGERDQRRYSTEQQAIQGHARLVLKHLGPYHYFRFGLRGSDPRF